MEKPIQNERDRNMIGIFQKHSPFLPFDKIPDTQFGALTTLFEDEIALLQFEL